MDSALAQAKAKRVFWVITIVLVAVYAAYAVGKFKTLPCEAGWLQAFKRNFIHVDLTHLVANLASFWILSRIEMQHGSVNYAVLIAALLALFTTGEVLLNRGKKPKQCAIGFSGILFGLLAWEVVTNHVNLNAQLLVALILSVVGTSMKNPRASLKGHAMGVVVGLIVGAITRILRGKQNKSNKTN